MDYIRGGLIFTSKYKMNNKPEIFSAGGFEVIDASGRTFMFDWCESSSTVTFNNEGYMEIECNFRDFDDDFFGQSNEGIKYDEEEITPKFLTSCKLVEAYYECFDEDSTNTNNDTAYPLIITEFALYNEDGQFNFSEEEIARYEKENAYHFEEIV